jgi:hypothetical protein
LSAASVRTRQEDEMIELGWYGAAVIESTTDFGDYAEEMGVEAARFEGQIVYVDDECEPDDEDCTECTDEESCEACVGDAASRCIIYLSQDGLLGHVTAGEPELKITRSTLRPATEAELGQKVWVL